MVRYWRVIWKWPFTNVSVEISNINIHKFRIYDYKSTDCNLFNEYEFNESEIKKISDKLKMEKENREKLKKENEVIQKIVDEKEKDLFEETAYWPQKGKGEGLAVPKSSTYTQ